MAPEPIRRKLVIVGDGACGKTSLLNVFALGSFPSDYEPTIFENYAADVRLDGKEISLQCWDTAGQEEYERLRPLSYSQAHVILIAFSVDTPDSLENVTVKWIEEVRNICGSGIPVILVGCKSDLREDAESRGHLQAGEYISTAQGREVSQEIGARAYYECSALRNEGVDNVFEAATRAALLSTPKPNHGRSGASGGHHDKKHGGRKEKNPAGGCQCVVL